MPAFSNTNQLISRLRGMRDAEHIVDFEVIEGPLGWSGGSQLADGEIVTVGPFNTPTDNLAWNELVFATEQAVIRAMTR